MEAHPPLGKQLIALGEWLFHPNADTTQFLGTDHAKNTPEGYSFEGYRFFPALLGWLTAPILFFIFLRITRRPLWAGLFCSLYIFDTALIVHARGAMLEGPQLFFIALMVLCFMQVWRRVSEAGRAHGAGLLWWSLGTGACFGAIMATKVNGLIFAPLLAAPLLLLRDAKWGKGLAACLLSLLGAMLTYLPPWYVHFSLGTSINTQLPDRGLYQASREYREALKEKKTDSLALFPTFYRDSLAFVAHYQKGVPKLNLCNKDENGSPAWWWPLGGRSINYRWERDGEATRYLFLQSNPAVWFLGLAGILGSLALLFGSFVSRGRLKLKQPALMSIFASLYLGYMAVMLQLPRVMYLYHYFIPLLISFFLSALVFVELRSLLNWRLTPSRKTALLLGMTMVILGGFVYFRPLAYSLPLTRSEVESRAWLSVWDLRCPACERTNRIASPTCDPKVKDAPDVAINGIRADSGTQEWGDPQQDTSVEERPIVVKGIPYSSAIGVHAYSSLKFKLNRKYAHFSGSVALPDYLAEKPQGGGTVIFEIYADGEKRWQSPVVKVSEDPVAFSVPLGTSAEKNAQILELVVRDAGDGNTNDHAVWLNLTLSE
jgi:dolichyl-phosphate-mannose--protein O-mannosyl transferase